MFEDKVGELFFSEFFLELLGDLLCELFPGHFAFAFSRDKKGREDSICSQLFGFFYDFLRDFERLDGAFGFAEFFGQEFLGSDNGLAGDVGKAKGFYKVFFFDLSGGALDHH